MIALLIIVVAVAGSFGLGVYVGRRTRRCLPGNVHLRYTADTSEAVAAIRALDNAVKAAPVHAKIYIGAEWDDETPRTRAVRFAKERK